MRRNVELTIVSYYHFHLAKSRIGNDYILVRDTYVSKLHFQEKFRKLEKRDKTAADDEDGFSSKKIHVRSKDPSKIARQFEKSEKNGKNGVRPGPKVKITPTIIFDQNTCILEHFSLIRILEKDEDELEN